ncbi:Palmitoyltransferase ERF2 [Orchesella cincta]|uniref:Palmitoyltransferase n=1 Tax=Orchesella cincta TaxID=48709 RepID=A0A1D2N9A3_ORCCI|nr:Palmitoyltransferase ERF2 [Orchesella cincta]
MFNKGDSNSFGWRLKNWWNTNMTPWTEKVVFKLHPVTVQLGAYFFVGIAALLTYLYGTFLVIPEVLTDYPPLLLTSLQILTTILLLGVYSNLYLVRKRKSTIEGRLLLQPVVKPMSSNVSSMDVDCQLREKARHLGQHFTPTPFGEDHNWHICGTCEVFVPPRTWHCHVCNTCILRRDHHCVFTACCIGEENQCNFLGLLLYLGLGTTLSSGFSFVYFVYWKEMSIWWYFLRLFVMMYTIIFDFSAIQLLATVSTFGQAASWGVFWYYIVLAFKGQTASDAHRKVSRTSAGASSISYENMRNFLGPYPLLRIVWPFCKPIRADYGQPNVQKEELDRKGL